MKLPGIGPGTDAAAYELGRRDERLVVSEVIAAARGVLHAWRTQILDKGNEYEPPLLFTEAILALVNAAYDLDSESEPEPSSDVDPDDYGMPDTPSFCSCLGRR